MRSSCGADAPRTVRVSSCERHQIWLKGFSGSLRLRGAAASKRPGVDDIPASLLRIMRTSVRRSTELGFQAQAQPLRLPRVYEYTPRSEIQRLKRATLSQTTAVQLYSVVLVRYPKWHIYANTEKRTQSGQQFYTTRAVRITRTRTYNVIA